MNAAGCCRSPGPRQPRNPDHGQIVDAVPISGPPADVTDRAVPGHWEGDLPCGTKESQIATLVERQSRYLILVKVPSKDTKTVVDALIKRAFETVKDLGLCMYLTRGVRITESSNYDAAPPMPPTYGVPRKIGPNEFETKNIFYITAQPQQFDRISKGAGWGSVSFGVLLEQFTIERWQGVCIDHRLLGLRYARKARCRWRTGARQRCPKQF